MKKVSKLRIGVYLSPKGCLYYYSGGEGIEVAQIKMGRKQNVVLVMPFNVTIVRTWEYLGDL
jgi:hypothetical protein